MFERIRAMVRRDVERRFFDAGPEGEKLWIPWGAANPLARASFVLGDDGVRQRIADTMVASDLRVYGFTVVFVIGCLLMFTLGHAVPPDLVKPLVAAYLIVSGVVLCALLATPVLLLRRLGPLPPGPSRSIRNVVSLHERELRGSWSAWLLVAVMGAVALVVLAGARQLFLEGQPGSAAALAILGLIPLSLAALGPAVLRMRRLRLENQRLEALVAERTQQLQDLNRTLEQRVQEQVQHIERLGQLKHFFAAPVAEKILSEKTFDPSRVHRRELTSVSMDLRGFTAFSETAEPEEVISVLRTYHAEMGIQVSRHRATLEHFAGDGVMIFLNDPVEIDDHPMRALELAVALREAMRPHLAHWGAQGFDLGMGVGIATGFATIGTVGYDGRWEYAAIGTVNNLAARLCSEAKDGQIVVSSRFVARLGGRAELEPLGERALKGFTRPVATFNVVSLKAPSPLTA